jgi:hypothetical protein
MAKKKSGGGSSVTSPNFLILHGEKAGVVASAALAVLLLGTSLLMPGSGLFSGSPDDNAKALDQLAKQAQDQLRSPSNRPQPKDLPPSESLTKRVVLDRAVVSADRYQITDLVPGESGPPPGRKVPRIFTIEEGLAAVGRVQFLTYILTERDGEECLVMLREREAKKKDDKKDDKKLKGKFGPAPSMPGMGPGMGKGGPGMGKGGPGMGMMPGALPTSVEPAEDEKRREKEPVFVPLKSLDSKGAGLAPAVQIRPQRIAVVTGSFPFRKQVEEFRARLALRSNSEVLSEASREPDKDGKPIAGLTSFRFKGVNVQRRELDGNGQPSREKDRDGNILGDWRTLDLAGRYQELIRAAGQEFEHDDPVIGNLSFTGLVMHKLKQFRPEEHNLPAVHGGGLPSGLPGGGQGRMGGAPTLGGGPPKLPGGGSPPPTPPEIKVTPSQYPAVERSLPLIAKTIDSLRGKKAEEVASPSRFSGVPLDPFGVPSLGAPEEKPSGMVQPPSSADQEVPEYCLVRVIDVDVAPGRIYEYRLQIRMANPNLYRQDVASPHYALPENGQNTELLSDWSTTPIRVMVPEELIYYAVDQKAFEEAPGYGKPKKYAGEDRTSYSPDYMVFQAHKWIKEFPLASGASLIVGDWAIAERIAVQRGEYIGRPVRVTMPVWRYQRQSYVLTTDDTVRKMKKGQPGLQVPFGYGADTRKAPAPEAILVDFEQSGERSYTRDGRNGDEKSEPRRVTDSAASQALILTPDGRLLLREGALDTFDEGRIARLHDFRSRVEEVKKTSTKTSSPLGGKGG